MAEYDPFSIFESTSTIVQDVVTTTTSTFQLTEFQKGLLLGIAIYYLFTEGI